MKRMTAALLIIAATASPVLGRELPQPSQSILGHDSSGPASTASGTIGSAGLAQNPRAYGALGNGASSAAVDTAAFQQAITSACATAVGLQGGVVEVKVPQPPVAYYISRPLSVCSNLHVSGIGGYPTIFYTGTGSIDNQTGLFLNEGGQRNIEIDHLDLEGQSRDYAWAYYAKHTNRTISSINVRLHDLLANGFGSGAYHGTGGTIWIDNDSAGNSVYNNVLGGTATILKISAPTDRFHAYDNFFESTDGGAYCIVGTEGEGAGPVYIDHNIFSCENGGAMKVDSRAIWIIANNEEENTRAISNEHRAVFDLHAASTVIFLNNSSNAHGTAAYDVYVADDIVNSSFANTIGANATGKVLRVGGGRGNSYVNNHSNLGPAAVYTADYVGIQQADIANGPGVQFGCGATTTTVQIPYTYCGEVLQQSSATSTTINQYWLSPKLATGQVSGLAGGVANSANNGWQLLFSNAGGKDSTSNRVTLQVTGGTPLTITPAGIEAGAYTVGRTAGVSCSGMPTAAFATINGIVTHC